MSGLGGQNGGGRLTAILLNPPLGRDPTCTVTYQTLLETLPVFACDTLAIVNLFAVPTRDLPGVNEAGGRADGWLRARRDLTRTLAKADCIVAAWGVGGLAGDARRNLAWQVAWVSRVAHELGHRLWWQIGGRPRHPSRWRQYVGPTRGVATGSNYADRIRSVIVAVPI